MRFYTFGIKLNKPVVIEIIIKITKMKSDNSGLDFLVMNMGNDIKNSLINASNLFAKTDVEYFKNQNIKIEVSSSENYNSPFLTSLFYASYVFDRFKIDPPKILIAGDLMQNGESPGYIFSIFETIKKENLFNDYGIWVNLSSADILKNVCAIKIQRYWKNRRGVSKLKKLYRSEKGSNYDLQIFL